MSASAESDPPRATAAGHGRQILGLMAKYWTPGEVKTRLGATVGNRISAGLAPPIRHPSVPTALQRSVTIGRLSSRRRRPSNRWRHACQIVGTSGPKPMAIWVPACRLGSPRRFRAGGFDRAVLIGADCPTLKPSEIQYAFELLNQHQVVIGPAHDGGYYLIGLQNPLGMPHDLLSTDLLFTNMHWSREDVFEITRRRIDQAGWSLGLLPTKSDIDQIDDLQQLRDELKTTRETDPFDGELTDQISRLLDEADAESAR